MDDFAVCTQTCESDGHILVKLDGNLRRTDMAKSDTEIRWEEEKCESTAG